VHHGTSERTDGSRVRVEGWGFGLGFRVRASFDWGFGVRRHLATQVASAKIVCLHSYFADAARDGRMEKVVEQGSSGFQLSLAWRGLRAPKVCSCAVAHNCFKWLTMILATQGALRRPTRRRSDATKVDNMWVTRLTWWKHWQGLGSGLDGCQMTMIKEACYCKYGFIFLLRTHLPSSSAPSLWLSVTAVLTHLMVAEIVGSVPSGW